MEQENEEKKRAGKKASKETQKEVKTSAKKTPKEEAETKKKKAPIPEAKEKVQKVAKAPKEKNEETISEEKLEKEEKPVLSKKPQKTEVFTSKEVIALILITCVVNFLLMTLLVNRFFATDTFKTNNIDDENLKQIIETYQQIKDNFYDINGNLDTKDIVSGAIEGMMEALGDEHSIVVPDDDQTYNTTLQGEYQGLGVEIVRNFDDGKIHILRVFDDSPADRAGLKEDDIILSLDGESTDNMTTSTFGEKVKSGTSESYTLEIERDGKKLSFTMTREHVIIDSVKSEMIEKDNKKVGYIQVEVFAANTDLQFRDHLEKLESDGMQSLIIDLRGNTGGHLSAVTNMISEFLDESNIIYQTDKKGQVEVTYSTGKVTKNYPIVILANGASASASEVMIGALTEKKDAKLVGTKTYGKGTAQELIDIKTTGQQYKITTKKWLTPNGVWINGIGFTPDYVVELSEKYYEEPTRENDNQFAKALEVALNSIQ